MATLIDSIASLSIYGEDEISHYVLPRRGKKSVGTFGIELDLPSLPRLDSIPESYKINSAKDI